MFSDVSFFIQLFADGSDSESNHQYESVQNQSQLICDDFDGSFDSDSSFDDDGHPNHRLHRDNGNDKLPESHCNRTLPSIPPQNDGIYGFMKQAGRKMRKHWPIGKSLRRIRKMSVGAVVTSTATASDDQGAFINVLLLFFSNFVWLTTGNNI